MTTKETSFYIFVLNHKNPDGYFTVFFDSAEEGFLFYNLLISRKFKVVVGNWMGELWHEYNLWDQK